MGRIARPTREDSLVRASSEAVGGPIGDHAGPHPWWTPVRVVLAVACVAFLLGLLQKAPCVASNWADAEVRYAAMCYSDVPYLYSGRGFAERSLPFSDTGGRHPVMEYPVVIGYVAYGATLITHALSGWPDVDERRAAPPERVYGLPGVAAESGLYFLVTAVIMAGFLLVAAYFLAGVHRSRPWDAMAFAASPALVLSGLVNWDLVVVACVAVALWAWARGRPVLTGVMVGLGTATKLYPLFLLGAVLVVCLRTRRLRDLGVTVGAAVAAWLVVNAPVMLLAFDQWLVFWTFNSDRGADLGSWWLVLQQAGTEVSAHSINVVSWLAFAAVCVAVLVLGLWAPQTPRVAQLGLLIVLGFLLVNKVYSPQYVLWLLPLAVLARPRWRDLLLWQASEIFYFGAVWLYLGEFTAPGASGEPDRLYWAAIGVRIVGELYLAAVVTRDVLRPGHDPVGRDPVPVPAEVGPRSRPLDLAPGRRRRA